MTEAKTQAPVSAAEKIAAANDALRKSLSNGRVVITHRVAMAPGKTRAAILQAVRDYNAFDPENDPYGERDFGAVTVEGERYFWKIDDYDAEIASRNSNLAATIRVITIMHWTDY